jgi:DNA phosphorothioation-associated DGQHR protein 1
MTMTFPFSAPALRVEQPMGVYFVAVLPAELLLTVCFSDRLRIAHRTESSYTLEGNQRQLDEKRLRTIGDFISRSDSAFPNSIILAANSRAEDGLVEEQNAPRWSVSEKHDDGTYTITIPTGEKLAAIIDGQHRLFSFAFAIPKRLEMSLVCSIFFDLNKPFQAQLFATINSTQKPVDRSQTYELFGYNILEESESYWSPDKLAVFLARKLNTDEASPIKGRIAIAPEGDLTFGEDAKAPGWHVSMATVVDGILRLFSSNPKQDANELLDSAAAKKRASLAESKRKDRSPLRDLYLRENDKVIYSIVTNFLTAAKDVFWDKAETGSFIVKTVGIQALFDILRDLAPEIQANKQANVSYFVTRLSPAGIIDFSSPGFRNASGGGRSAIRRAIKDALRLQ